MCAARGSWGFMFSSGASSENKSAGLLLYISRILSSRTQRPTRDNHGYLFLLLKVSSQLNVHYQKKAQLFTSPQLSDNIQKKDKPGHYKAAHFVPDTIIKYELLH